ncbi:MAG: hypothetical protein NT045_01890 [Candidatus Aureabacteria bacterium]|nr:hypothetical protein [Candidatus Auribacterota bacterium]
MALTTEQQEVLALMRRVVESYHTLGVGSAHTFERLARDYFKKDVDIRSTIDAVHSRRGDRIYAELARLQEIILGIEKEHA